MNFFPLCILRQKKKKTGQEKRFLDYKKQGVHKSPKIGIFLKGKSIFFVKTLKLFHISIVGKEGKEKVFDDILETKKASMTIKTRSKKKHENLGFFQRG